MSKNKILVNSLLIIILITFTFNSISYATSPLNEKLKEYREVINFYAGVFTAITLLISVGILMVLFLKLGSAHNHPLIRKKIIDDIGVVLIGVALIGSAGLIVTIVTGGWFLPSR